MKLTNYQLEVLRKEIEGEVLEKIENLKKTKKYRDIKKKILEKEKGRISYIEEKQKIIEEKTILEEKLRVLTDDYKQIYGQHLTIVTLDRFYKDIEVKAVNELRQSFPSKKKIEATIILNSLENNSSLLEKVRKILKLN